MKIKELIKTIILLIVTLGLSGCLDNGSNTATPYIPNDKQPKPFGKVAPLPEKIVDAYKAVGIKPNRLSLIYDAEGNVHLFEYSDKDDKLIELEPVYPHDAKKINKIINATILLWTKSKCTTVIIDGREERRCEHI